MQELINQTQNYLNYINKHYNLVQMAWFEIQKYCQGQKFKFLDDEFWWSVLDEEIKNHDKSKLSTEEFHPYRFKFYPTNEEAKHPDYELSSQEIFDQAWEHHKNFNFHHWQTWTTKECPKKIPKELHAIHNLCDWIAMAKQREKPYLEYYEQNKDSIKIPQQYIKLFYKIVDFLPKKNG